MPASRPDPTFDPVLATLASLLGEAAAGNDIDGAVSVASGLASTGVLHVRHEPARPARLGAFADVVPDAVRARLGVDALWSHQAEALDAVLDGRSVIVSSGTASGKSLVAQAAIGIAGTADRPATALLLYPTKALGHDQLRALDAMGLSGVVAAAYDGDSTDAERTWVRRHANVIFTNPDMLHFGILPRHGQWSTFLRRLRYIVVDEAHVLRGIFGAHVAHVLRRLQRRCAALGADPTFVFASATVAEPAPLAQALCGQDVLAVTDDGSPRAERTVALANPPLLDPTTGARASSHRLTARVAAELVVRGLRTIVFCRSRHATETIAAAMRRLVPADLVDAIQPYRAGYLATERRSIEAALADGTLRAVVATSALELGIDIGGLDACVIHGFPGTIASFRQQIGRVGRGDAPSLSVLVAGTDQLDQYFAAHPDELFDRDVEPVVVNPSNPYVLDPQLCCAAAEQPLGIEDARWWGPELDEAIRRLVLDDRLRLHQRTDAAGSRSPLAAWAGHGHPAGSVGLRSGSSRQVRIVTDDGTLVGTVDGARAPAVLHPGAAYLHRTEPFRVVRFDPDAGEALVEPDDGSTTTRTRASSSLSLLGVDRERTVGRLTLALGPVSVESTITGYQRIDVLSGVVVDDVPLDGPPSTLITRGFWYTFAPEVIDAAELSPETVPGALHALEHAAIAMLPLFAICDRWDVGGISTPWLDDAAAATVAIYDGYPGGAGIAELGFAAADRHLSTTREMVVGCPCTTGCPSCIQSPKCGNGNEPLDKAGAVRLLRAALDG